MRTRRLLVPLGVLVLATSAVAAVSRQSRGVDEDVPSAALAGPVKALVVLPPDYATSGLRYPVVYFLHGLPAAPSAYRANGWIERALERAGPAILVEPQGARKGDSDPEYLNWGKGRNWETYVANELPRYIDRHYRTLPTRTGRAIVGLSAGGYGATVLGLHHLRSFSVVQSWSGYFHPTDPTGTKRLDRGPDTDVHRLVKALPKQQASRRTFFGFYVGRGDARFREENLELHRELLAAHIPHVFKLYSGGHDTSVWEAHAPEWLSMALDHLSKARR